MFKKNRTLLEKLKNLHPFSLENLPALIQIEGKELNIEQTTLDQLAFAIHALENKIQPWNRRLYALRELYDLARKHGALGAQRMEEIFAQTEKSRSAFLSLLQTNGWSRNGVSKVSSWVKVTSARPRNCGH